jgi:hypothetical protein
MPSKLSSSVNEVQTGKIWVKSDVTLPSSTQTPVCSRTFKSGRLEMIGFERYVSRCTKFVLFLSWTTVDFLGVLFSEFTITLIVLYDHTNLPISSNLFPSSQSGYELQYDLNPKFYLSLYCTTCRQFIYVYIYFGCMTEKKRPPLIKLKVLYLYLRDVW